MRTTTQMANPMTASEVLRKARALIEKPENWTQGAYARGIDDAGKSIKDACSLCTVGAVYAITNDLWVGGEKIFQRVLYWLGSALAGLGEPPHDSAEKNSQKDGEHGLQVIAFNDTHTHAEVLALFDRAIAAAEARGE